MPKEYDRRCPLARAATVIEKRWTLLVLREIANKGPRRFQDLIDTLDGIPPNTLSDRLKTLEKAGVIVKETYEKYPPRAHYVLSECGKELHMVLKALRAWGEKYTKE